MTFQKKQAKLMVITISLISCIISVMVFVYVLSQTSNIRSESFATSFTREQVITAINKERVKNALPPLIQNKKLSLSAQSKTDDMANPEQSYFSHISPSNKRWSDFIKETNYDYAIAGENLANGFESIVDMIDAWMNSPTHRENILNSEVVETGIGITLGKLDDTPTIFVSQHFGKPADSMNFNSNIYIEEKEPNNQLVDQLQLNPVVIN